MSLWDLVLDTQLTHVLVPGSSHLQLCSAQIYKCANGSQLTPVLHVAFHSCPEPPGPPGRQARPSALSSILPRLMTALIPVSQVTYPPH